MVVVVVIVVVVVVVIVIIDILVLFKCMDGLMVLLLTSYAILLGWFPSIAV